MSLLNWPPILSEHIGAMRERERRVGTVHYIDFEHWNILQYRPIFLNRARRFCPLDLLSSYFDRSKNLDRTKFWLLIF